MKETIRSEDLKSPEIEFHKHIKNYILIEKDIYNLTQAKEFLIWYEKKYKIRGLSPK